MADLRPVAVDLFAGAGGMGLGFEQAGFNVAAAVEIDPIHCAVHRFNFPGCPVIPRSASEVDAAGIREAAGIGDAPVDCVIGGPPCQGFSMMGKRAMDDPRNSLVRDFMRIARELGARTFVFENVSGLAKGRQKDFLEEIVEGFAESGYRTHWEILNAADYGVPQNRHRLIMIGARRGEPLPRHPAGDLMEDPVTASQAMEDLPDAESFPELLSMDSAAGVPVPESVGGFAARMRCMDADGWGFGHVREWDPELLTSSLRTRHLDRMRRRFREAECGAVEPRSRFFKLHPDRPSNTLRAGTGSDRGSFTSPRPIHYARARCVTVREMARLHGFPDWFRLHRTVWHGGRQVGNSVPPPLARAIGREVMDALGFTPERPAGTLRLGDPSLLHMTPKQAMHAFAADSFSRPPERSAP